MNRYVTLALQGDAAFVSVALLFGAQPALVVRREADGNEDGVIDTTEQGALRGRYQAQSAAWLTLSRQGQALPFAPIVSVDLGTNPSVSGGAIVVEATMKVPLPSKGTHEFGLAPKAHPPPQGETEVTVVLGPGWQLQPGANQQRTFKIEGPAPPNFEATFTVRREAKPRLPRPWMLIPTLALATAVWLVVRWRRRS